MDGTIRKSKRGDLSIYNYTETCQYSRAWDQYTIRARGLILDADGCVVASPFPKFFNVGEPDCPALPTNVEYDVFQKVDGSLGIWYFYDGGWHVATRGSLDNDYTTFAQAYSHLLVNFPDHWTVLTEICMPASWDGLPRAVKHDPGVYFLGARNRLTHEDYNPHAEWGRWPSAVATWGGRESIESFLQAAREQEGTEGWVVRFDNGLRVKIKTSWYLRLFRAISDLSEKRIKELMTQAGLDDWLKDFPEELQADAKAIYDAIFTRFQERRTVIMRDFIEYNHPDRKTFALSILSHPDKSYLFTLYDGRDIDKRLILEC